MLHVCGTYICVRMLAYIMTVDHCALLHGSECHCSPCFQSFCSALLSELTEYYRLVAVLEAQHGQAEGGGAGGRGLTLRRLVVWSHDPLKKLKILGTLVDACKRMLYRIRIVTGHNHLLTSSAKTIPKDTVLIQSHLDTSVDNSCLFQI